MLQKDHLTVSLFHRRLLCAVDVDPRRWGISNPIWVYDNELYEINKLPIESVEQSIPTTP